MNSDAWRTLLPAAGASPRGETSAASPTEISAGPSWPLDFGDRAGEYAALQTGGAIVPLVGRSLIEATGADAAKFLHNLSTNDVRRLAPGAGCETFFLNAKGHVLAHAGLICRPDAILIDAVPGAGPALVAHLDRYLIREQVVLTVRSSELAALYIAGDAAPAQLTAIGLVELPESPWANGSIQVAGAEVLAVRAPWTASVGWLLWVLTEALEAVWNALCGAGVRPVGSLSLDAARIEHRFPLYGRDISDRTLPQEVGRDAQAISFVKGCYIGQETVARIDALGHVNRRLVSLRCDNPTPLAPGSPLTQAGQTVGEITSSASVPGLGRAVAMAYVRRGHDALGAKLDSEAGACEIVAA